MLLLIIGSTVVAGMVGLRLMYPWLMTDLKYIFTLFKHAIKYTKEGRLQIDYFEENVRAHPDKVALIYKDQSYTYKELNQKANKAARAVQSLDIKLGETIAVFMHNSPEFLWLYLGLMKIGVTPSLLNTSLKGKQLLHCITVSEPKIIIVGEDADLGEALLDILSDLQTKVYVYSSPQASVPSAFLSFCEVLSKVTDEEVDRQCRKSVKLLDCACYIFTSGTTGLPKPAVVVHKRVLAGAILALTCGVRPDDVWYICLPLFHSNGLLVGSGAGLSIGATVVMTKKFSRTHFFEDCRKYNVTVVNYIGELLRYLLTNEKSDLDTQHKIRMAIGNGLRQDIFQEFQERFKIPVIREFYAATEGSIGFLNFSNKVGSCGRCSPLLRMILKCNFCKYDTVNECLVRDKNGHCIPAKQGEPGLLLGGINKLQIFDGYKGKKELTENKIVRNVEKDGDAFFNSGDLFTLDEEYNLFFNDRIGDTYRWKGENVSTTEVSNLLTDLEFVVDACVYGVNIPGQDGKAGMATLLISSNSETIDDAMLDAISQHCNKTFPLYSKPVFIRLQWGSLMMTSTIKQNKISLKQEGYDVSRVTDPLFYFDKSGKKFQKLEKAVYSQIQDQSIQI